MSLSPTSIPDAPPTTSSPVPNQKQGQEGAPQQVAQRVAVVLFNLGGPLKPADVRPFLFNLFNDRAILRLPRLPRWLLAQLISRLRASKARGIYAGLGGGSPLLANTRAQAEALTAALQANSKAAGNTTTWQVTIAMRYWHPMTAEAVRQVQAFAPDHLVLLPLYPQFSTTTTASSVKAWRQAAARQGLNVPTTVTIGCYPAATGLIDAYAELAAAKLAAVPAGLPVPRLLYSAHGLPEKIVQDGDPYPIQVTLTAEAITARLRQQYPDCAFDPRLCYQSRVGPVKWIEPSTEQEIEAAGQAGVPLVVLPIAFVSEHSETLVELDEEYAHLAQEAGVPHYGRVPTVDSHPAFIADLASQVVHATHQANGTIVGPKICPPGAICLCRNDPITGI